MSTKIIQSLIYIRVVQNKNEALLGVMISNIKFLPLMD